MPQRRRRRRIIWSKKQYGSMLVFSFFGVEMKSCVCVCVCLDRHPCINESWIDIIYTDTTTQWNSIIESIDRYESEQRFLLFCTTCQPLSTDLCSNRVLCSDQCIYTYDNQQVMWNASLARAKQRKHLKIVTWSHHVLHTITTTTTILWMCLLCRLAYLCKLRLLCN